MKTIKAYVESVHIHYPAGFDSIDKWIESIGRTCYKSEDKITDMSAEAFVKMLKKRNHKAMFDHAFVTARIVADRGFSHEAVRHRLAAYAQESTRYCNYSKGKFNSEITVVEQPDIIETNNPAILTEWMNAMVDAERHYLRLIELGAPTGGARSVLPIGLKTELVMTASLTEWIHVFSLRTAPAAHSIMREVMINVKQQLVDGLPSIIGEENDNS